MNDLCHLMWQSSPWGSDEISYMCYFSVWGWWVVMGLLFSM